MVLCIMLVRFDVVCCCVRCCVLLCVVVLVGDVVCGILCWLMMVCVVMVYCVSTYLYSCHCVWYV